MSIRNIIQKVERETSVTDIGGGGLSEAPLDSDNYGRKNGDWNEVAIPNDIPSPFSTFVYDPATGTRFINGDIPNNYAIGDTGLTKIYIGNSVTSIGGGAFRSCENLIGNLIIPDSVEFIGIDTFRSCLNLTTLKIGNSVTTISIAAFQDCIGFTGNLIIPNSVLSIGSNAFYGCAGFLSLTIGNSVTTIGNSAFRFCGNFQGDLVIPDSVVTVSPRAFRLAGFTGNLIIGSGVTSIGLNAFSVCGFTGYVSVPSSATVIGSGAFASCASLTTAYLNQPFAQVATDCFLSSGVTTVYIGPDATGWTLGAGQTIGGKSGITVALWTNYPNVP